MRNLLKIHLPLVVLAASACSSSTDQKVPVPPHMPIVEAPVPVDPEVEKWFRSHEPAAGTRIVAGDRIAISVQGRPELAVTRDVPPNGDVPVYVPNHAESSSVNALGKTAQQLEA